MTPIINLRLAIPLVIVFIVTFAVLSPDHVGHGAALRPDRNGDAVCNLDYVGILLRGQNAQQKPQLSFEQMLWIATLVQTSSLMTTTAGHNFLVWGLGYDSQIWHAIHCSPTSRATTVFIENWRDWIDKIKSREPDLSVVHFDNYDSSVETAESFFTKPYLLPLPPSISEKCWNVVLVGRLQQRDLAVAISLLMYLLVRHCVDAPQGYEPAHPGRHAATYWSVQRTITCLRTGTIPVAYVFLHDANRPLERQIIERILEPNGGVQIGEIKGPAGTLVGFVMRTHTLRKG
jgi:hypothetical protein